MLQEMLPKCSHRTAISWRVSRVTERDQVRPFNPLLKTWKQAGNIARRPTGQHAGTKRRQSLIDNRAASRARIERAFPVWVSKFPYCRFYDCRSSSIPYYARVTRTPLDARRIAIGEWQTAKGAAQPSSADLVQDRSESAVESAYVERLSENDGTHDAV